MGGNSYLGLPFAASVMSNVDSSIHIVSRLSTRAAAQNPLSVVGTCDGDQPSSWGCSADGFNLKSLKAHAVYSSLPPFIGTSTCGFRLIFSGPHPSPHPGSGYLPFLVALLVFSAADFTSVSSRHAPKVYNQYRVCAFPCCRR
jgi:hypothetical protein